MHGAVQGDWGDDDAVLLRLTCDFFTADSDAWSTLTGAFGHLAEDGSRWGFYALPPTIVLGNSYFLSFGMHKTDEEDDPRLHWEVEYQMVTSDPPDWVVDISDEVGGLPDALNRVSELWQAALTIAGSFDVQFLVPSRSFTPWKGTGWRGHRPIRRHIKTESGRVTLSPERQRWILDEPLNNVEAVELVLLPQNFFTAKAVGQAELTLEPALFGSLANNAWRALSQLFRAPPESL